MILIRIRVPNTMVTGAISAFGAFCEKTPVTTRNPWLPDEHIFYCEGVLDEAALVRTARRMGLADDKVQRFQSG